MLKYDLGGHGGIPGYLSVNLIKSADICCDITELDSFCDDGTVTEFRMSHVLEHIPLTKYESFLRNLHRKLVNGGTVKIIHTDAESVIKQWIAGSLTFRSMRATLFTPGNRIKINQYHQHMSMHTPDILIDDFKIAGFSKVEKFDAGSWAYDVLDDIMPSETSKDFGKQIAQLGIKAYK